MQQGHPRRKQLDRAKHELKMHYIHKHSAQVAKTITGLLGIASAFGEFIVSAKKFREAFKKNVSSMTVETKIDSGLTSIEM